MRTIESIKLYFQEGNSDKVYEVDLCQVENDLYVVNFRYGRRGANLREGAKTVFPVAYEEAKNEYDKLVSSKVKKGYRASLEESNSTPEPKPIAPVDTAKQVETITRHLTDAANGNYTGSWRLSRVVWRAGELEIKECAESVTKLIQPSDSLLTYSGIWTLSRIKSEAGLDIIYKVYDFLVPGNKSHRLATNYLLRIENPKSETIKKEVESRIPSLLLPVIHSGDPNSIEQGINELIANPGPATSQLLVDLYHLTKDNQALYTALFKVLEKVPTKINYFRAVRHIFKLSELNSDHLYYGLLSKKIFLHHSNYNIGYGYTYMNGKYVKIVESQRKEDTVLSFSDKTKQYLSRRVLKVLNKVSVDTPDQYAKWATGILLAASDETDQFHIRTETVHSWVWTDQWNLVEQKFWYPKYETHAAYLSILYGRSDRFESNSKGTRWRYKTDPEGTDELNLGREERNPELWDQSPAEVIRLLSNGKVVEVLNFAIKVFKANPAFADELSNEALFGMMSNSYAPVSDLSINIIEERYRNETPSFELIAGLLGAASERGVKLGMEWLEKYWDQHLDKSDHLVKLVLVGSVEVLKFIEEKLSSLMSKRPLDKVLFSQIEPLLKEVDKYTDEFLDGLIDFVKAENISTFFDSFQPEELNQLIRNEREKITALGIALMRANALPSYELSKDIIDDLLSSESETLRVAGLDLLQDYPAEYLNANHQLIRDFCFSEYPEVRERIEPVARNLIVVNEAFRASLFNKLIESISGPERYEGVHESNMTLLNNLYQSEMRSMPKEQILELLFATTDPALKLGEKQFYDQNLITKLEHEEIIELAKCDVRQVRFEIEKYFESDHHKIRYELESSLKVLASKWSDIRLWAFDFFLEKTEPQDWDLDLVLYAADNPKEDVQAFGRSLISKLFSSKEGETLMLRLSEHPSRSMMLFTSNYLDIHAKGKEEVVIQLRQYFKNILFGVNEGAKAKARVFDFLKKEAVKSKAVAEMVTELLNELLATRAIGDKSHCIDILLTIKETFEDIELPIHIIPTKPYEHAV